MKFIKKLLGKEEEETPKPTPTWDIKPLSDRTSSRKKTIFDEPLPSQQAPKEKNPFLDDKMLDTMTLETGAVPEDNPYETHSWEQDLDNDTRKLRTIQIGEKSEKPADSQYNPYDTGSMKRGWKK
jgi:hypothetical protein